MKLDRRKKVNIDMNIAPLIDVVFLLLIFFMLSSQFVTQPGIKISLPGALTAKPQDADNIVIYITSDNDLYLDNKIVSIVNLREILKNKFLKSKNKTIIIKGDENVNLGFTVKIIDIARQADATGVVISTKMNEKD